MSGNLKIALVRMFSEKGAVRENLAATARYIEEAEKRGIDIIAFPEASISGYIEPARFPHAVLRQDGPEVAEFVKMTEGKHLTALAGIIEEKPGSHPFITHVIARNGAITGFYRKMNTGEDEPWFSPGNEFKVFRHDDLTYGIAICADIAFGTAFATCADRGAKIIFEVAAPGLYGDQATRDWKSGYEWWEGYCRETFTAYARDFNIWIAVATQAGRTCDEDFPGGGYLFNPKGERVYTADTRHPGVDYLEIDFDSGSVTEVN